MPSDGEVPRGNVGYNLLLKSREQKQIEKKKNAIRLQFVAKTFGFYKT